MGALLTGQLAYVFLVAILDAALISWVALRWYRRSVRRLMRERGAPTDGTAAVESAPGQPPPSAPVASPVPLTVAIFEAHDAAPSRRSPHAGIGWRRLSVAYGIGAALHSAAITSFFFGFDTSRPVAAWFAQWWVFAWPIVPTLAILLVLNRYEVIRLAIGYVVVGGIAIATVTLTGQVLRGSFSDAPLTNVFWFVASLAFAAALPLALLLITGWRRIRAVTPLALSSTLVFGFALMLFREALTEAFNLEAIRSVLLDVSARTSEYVMYYGVFMVLVLPVGWVAWRLLQYLAARFERKRFSDVQLVVDCWWLIVTADELVTHLSTTYGLRGIAAGIAAFATYRIGVALALAWLPGPHRDHSEKRLLLLRVFGYQERTETLFDRIAQQWRFHGPVQLIAGVDLAMRAVDPGDMLAFVSGRLDERYVATPDDVGRRVSGLDMRARSGRAIPRERSVLPRRHLAVGGSGAARHDGHRPDGSRAASPARTQAVPSSWTNSCRGFLRKGLSSSTTRRLTCGCWGSSCPTDGSAVGTAAGRPAARSRACASSEIRGPSSSC